MSLSFLLGVVGGILVMLVGAVFAGGGWLIGRETRRFRRHAAPARLRIVGHIESADDEGTTYAPTYEVLDGPHRGLRVLSQVGGLKRAYRLGSECDGWIDASVPTARNSRDHAATLVAQPILMVLGGAIAAFGLWLLAMEFL